MNDTPSTTPPVATADPSAAADLTPTAAERRAALRKLGALAALTPPTIMTLLLSPRAAAESPPLDP